MNNVYEPESLVNAERVTTTTLIGTVAERPSQFGNCFSVRTSDERNLRVLNFNYENLEALLERNMVQWPIEVLPLSNGHCLIADHRIPDEWYNDKLCSSCTPPDLLPPQQKLERILDLKSGRRKETKVEINGQSMVVVSYNIGVQPGIVTVPYKVTVGEPVLRDQMTPEDEEKLVTRYKDIEVDSKFYGRVFPDGRDNNDEQ